MPPAFVETTARKGCCMAGLPPFEEMKIEALTAAMKYAPRDDLASVRQELIDGVRREAIAVIRRAKKGGQIELEVDSDGDLVFKYEHSSFHFRLDVQQRIAGAQFKELYDHPLAMEIVKTFYGEVVRVLGLRDADVFTVDFRNVFKLGADAPKNYAVFQAVLMPTMREALRPLLLPETELGRLDFKLGWDRDARHTCYFSIECPGNEENTTVWTNLNLRTREDIVVSVDQAQIGDDVDAAYRVYCGDYAETIASFLKNVSVDLERRQLIRK